MSRAGAGLHSVFITASLHEEQTGFCAKAAAVAALSNRLSFSAGRGSIISTVVRKVKYGDHADNARGLRYRR
jgi:hypothetical protein